MLHGTLCMTYPTRRYALEQTVRNLPTRLRQVNSPGGRKAAAKKTAQWLLGMRGYESVRRRVRRDCLKSTR